MQLSAGEANSQIFFTTDGTDPLTGVDLLADGVTHYTGPITIASTTTLKAVAFDPAGNVSTVLEATYIIDGNGVVPGAPTINSTSVGVGSVTLDWSLDAAFVVTDYAVSGQQRGWQRSHGPRDQPDHDDSDPAHRHRV